VFGYGWIGALVASYGRAFDMKVQVWGRAGSLMRAREAGYETAPDQRTFFETSDIVTLHLRMLPETDGIVTAADLAAMKPDALFVNTSRAALVEKGALWPSPTKWGKALFLSKTDEPSTDPMEYRILLILSRLYRRWASLRLRDLHGWIQQWQMPEMYAGVPGEAQSSPGGTSAPSTRTRTTLVPSLPAPLSTSTSVLTGSSPCSARR